MERLSDNYIKEAARYYGADDKNFIKNVLRAASEARCDEELFSRFEKVSKILYEGRDDDRYALRKNTEEELFGIGAPPYMTDLVVLSGYERHLENMKRFGLDDRQIRRHRMRVLGTLTDDLVIRHREGIRPSQMQWGTNFVLVKLIEVGRLQFERWPEKEGVVNMHIPAGPPLTRDSVISSIREALPQIEKYFGISAPRFECESWLLSREVREIAGDGSNIAAFFDMFDSHPFEDASEEILDYVFNLDEGANPETLPEKTSLQRKMKKALLEGRPMFCGEGALKKEIYELIG